MGAAIGSASCWPMSHVSAPQSPQVIGEVLNRSGRELWIYVPEERLVIACQDKERLRCRGLGPYSTVVSREQYTAPCGLVR